MKDELGIRKIRDRIFKKLEKFPDGRVNYSNSQEAITVNIFVFCEDELLILKRSNQVGNYRGFWNVVAGYYDELKAVGDKALEELEEETGIKKDQISEIKVREMIKLKDNKLHKIFYVFPIIIKLKRKPKVVLDWEHTESKWIKEKEILKYDCVYGLEGLIEKLNN